MDIVIILLTTIILILLLLFIKEKRANITLKESNRKLKQSRQTSLDYISAVWESQKSMVLNEKLKSLSLLVERISHILNTPLGITLTSLTHIEELLKNEENIDIDETRGVIKLALKNLQKSISLVNTFTKVNEEKTYVAPSVVDIKEFLGLICDAKKYQNTKIIIEENFKVYITHVNLSILLHKILDNANDFKNTKNTSHEITIKVERENKDLIIHIEDNGIGIHDKHINKIFTPLFTTKNEDTSQGLGLAIAYHIMTNHYNGEIKCTSIVEEGTTFTLKFPNVVVN